MMNKKVIYVTIFLLILLIFTVSIEFVRLVIKKENIKILKEELTQGKIITIVPSVSVSEKGKKKVLINPKTRKIMIKKEDKINIEDKTNNDFLIWTEGIKVSNLKVNNLLGENKSQLPPPIEVDEGLKEP